MILSGWKEIAQYTGRGVRTVQRWEHFGLPVRRPGGHLRSAVSATSEDIDTWLRTCGTIASNPDCDAVLETAKASQMALKTAIASHRELLEQQSALRKKFSAERQKLEDAEVWGSLPPRSVAC